MGLDSVELVMAVEEEFHIQISNHCAAQMVTVGLLVNHVHAAVNGVNLEQEREEWRKLDDIFELVIGRKVSDLPFETEVAAVLEAERLAEQWDALDLWPPVERPARVRWSIALGSVVAGLLVFVCLHSVAVVGILAGISAAVIVFLGLLVLAQDCREVPMDGCGLKIGDLVWWRRSIEPELISRGQVFERLRDLIAEQLSVEREMIEESSRFVEELGMA